MSAELCRDVAFEAARRCARINPQELWAVLEDVEALGPRLVVDIWSEPAVWWAWWSIGARVVGVTGLPVRPGRAFPGHMRMPQGITEIVGDPRMEVTRQQVAYAVGGQPVDAVVLGGPDSEDGVRSNFHRFAPMVRPGGVVLVRGIASKQFPGIGRFWSGLNSPDCRAMVGRTNPDGYGIVEIHGKEMSSNG